MHYLHFLDIFQKYLVKALQLPKLFEANAIRQPISLLWNNADLMSPRKLQLKFQINSMKCCVFSKLQSMFIT